MTTTNTVKDFAVGDRVDVEPTCWLFKAGAPSGVVVKVGRTKVHVRADVNGVVYQVAPRGLALAQDWLREEFAAAAERTAGLPNRARPTVTR